MYGKEWYSLCVERSGAPGVSEEVVCDEVEYPIDHLLTWFSRKGVG